VQRRKKGVGRDRWRGRKRCKVEAVWGFRSANRLGKRFRGRRESRRQWAVLSWIFVLGNSICTRKWGGGERRLDEVKSTRVDQGSLRCGGRTFSRSQTRLGFLLGGRKGGVQKGSRRFGGRGNFRLGGEKVSTTFSIARDGERKGLDNVLCGLLKWPTGATLDSLVHGLI